MHLASSLSKGARAQRGPRPVELTDVQRPQALGWPTGLEPVLRGSQPRVLAVTTRLKYGHVMGEAGIEPAASSVSEKRPHDTFGIGRTMFSKPLAYPSALDRR